MTTDSLPTIDLDQLDRACGGRGPTQAQQQEFRDLAKSYCPVTYAQNRRASQITRKMGEQCLDEAGLGFFKSRLDRYFGPKR